MSVGLRILDAEPRRGGGRIISRSQLLECSWVVVPANPQATIVTNALNTTRPIGEHRELMLRIGKESLPSLQRVAERGEKRLLQEAHRALEPATPFFRGEG